MSVNLEKSVERGGDGETWTATCPVNDGTCGQAGVSFQSSGWPTKKTALARLQEHVAEHKGEGLMSSLEAFREKHGLVASEDGKTAIVTAKDL